MYVLLCMYICLYVLLCMDVCMYVCTLMYGCVHVCMYSYAWMCACMYVLDFGYVCTCRNLCKYISVDLTCYLRNQLTLLSTVMYE